MTFDRVTLFNMLRTAFAPKAGLSSVQVTVVAAILDEWERRGYSDLRWLAYMLATAWGECTWKPIAETGKGKGRKYGVAVKGRVYYGRGLVQLTWHFNYVEMGRRLNLPLETDPDMALQVPVAVAILFEGMVHGLFARDRNGPHSLARYFNETTDAPLGARRIINGTDKKEAFARWHGIILRILQVTVRKPTAKTVEFDAPAPVDAAPAELPSPAPSARPLPPAQEAPQSPAIARGEVKGGGAVMPTAVLGGGSAIAWLLNHFGPALQWLAIIILVVAVLAAAGLLKKEKAS